MPQYEKWVKFLREQYPTGTRLRLREMKDSHSPVPPGTEGTVELVDDGCNIHMKWDNGRTLALVPGEDCFSVVQPKLVPLKLYMPLTIKQYEKDDYGTPEDEPSEVNNRVACSYEGEILRMIKRHERQEEAERGLMLWYYDQDTVKDKVVSLRPTVEVVQGTLMGVAVCMVKGPLTPKEMDIFKEYVSGQMSDGWGEGFEQQAVKVDDGEVYVSFWSAKENWNIKTEQELRYPNMAACLPELCFSVLRGSGALICIERGGDQCSYSRLDTNDSAKNRRIAALQNERLGVSRAQEEAMLSGVLFGWEIPEADPRNYDSGGHRRMGGMNLG